MICFENVSYSYGNKKVIDNVSLNIESGDFVALLGSNGTGKTTLVKMINGIIKPDTGTVTVCAMDTRSTKTSALAATVGFLFQNPDKQICMNTVREEISFGIRCAKNGAEKAEAQKRVERMLEEFGLDGNVSPFTLSRGEKQRLALVSVLAVQPKILVLDEPTTGLDYSECVHMMDYISELNSQGITVVMITHDMEIVLDYAKKVLVLAEGKALAFDEMRKVMKKRDILNAAKLLPPQIADLVMQVDDAAMTNVFTNAELMTEILRRKEK